MKFGCGGRPHVAQTQEVSGVVREPRQVELDHRAGRAGQLLSDMKPFLLLLHCPTGCDPDKAFHRCLMEPPVLAKLHPLDWR